MKRTNASAGINRRSFLRGTLGGVAVSIGAKNRWASEWLTWPDFGPYWAQIIRHAMRKEDHRGVFIDVRREGDQTRVVIDSVDDDGRFITDAQTSMTMIDPRLRRERIQMHPTAPGRSEAVIETPRRGAYHIDIGQQRSDGTTQRSSRGVTVGYSDELRLLPLGESTLRRIAEASGGRYDPSPTSIAAADGRTAREPLPLWPWIVMAALSLFVADVALRRIELAR